ncbi:MAG: Rab family GTPase [Candidatus Kariarchaeaceae archaeon]|jgi:small GTP-binding protein
MSRLPSFRILEIALLGDGNVGKTALLRRFKGEIFDPNYRITIGADFVVKKLQYDNNHITLQIWDVGGQPQFSALRSRHYKNAVGVLVVFDLMDRSSYESIPIWLTEVLQNNEWRIVPMILIGNKQDLVSNNGREISLDEIGVYVEQLRDWGHQLDPSFQIKYFETSAKAGTNVNLAFNGLLEYIM